MEDSAISHSGSSLRLAKLRETAPVILPSMLLCDFADLGGEVRALEQAGVTSLHLDVMDGHFVPNLTYGLPIVEACRRATDLPLEAHLMISNPKHYVEQYVAAGAGVVTVHVEASDDPRALLKRIRRAGAAAGLAFNPPTPVSEISPYLDDCDLVLVMGVTPGFGGQEFERVALEKLTTLKAMCDGGPVLEVDGGVNTATIAACAEAGAECFVVGSGIFRSSNYRDSIEDLRRRAQRGYEDRS